MFSLKRALPASRKRVDPPTALAVSAQIRRNFTLGVANGVMGGMLDPLCGVFVLTLFLTKLDVPHFLLGLLPAMWSWGTLLPQLLVAGKVRGKKRVMPWYSWASVGRVVALTIMSLSAWFLPANRDLALTGVFAGFLLYGICSGVSGIPFVEIVGKIVPPHRKGTFYGMRQFGSAIVSMVVTAIVGAVMAGNAGLQFPYNFAAMFTAGTVGGAVVWGLWSCVREPDLQPVQTPETASIFKLGLQAVKHNRDYRLFTIVRLLGTFSAISAPFYVLFATRTLNIPLGTMAIIMMIQTAISVVAGLAWAPLANRAPQRTLVLVTTALQFGVTLCALAAAFFAGMLPAGWQVYAVAPVFLMSTVAGSASIMFNDTVLLSIAPNNERPTYFGFLNTLAGVTSFALPLGGVLLEYFGYAPLFALSGTIALVAMIAGTGIERPARAKESPQVVRRALSWRLPRRVS